ncbi:hypothetical protein E2C01_034815 [Portunus trituberculatus]|uniref:Uncharacterized protein n=1 Tax=Portunus trituberculatus TaxID=210409 RepID=A0A5B7F7Y2_PORTR|nr:hypothetical protein [Portunus trituberculatus]
MVTLISIPFASSDLIRLPTHEAAVTQESTTQAPTQESTSGPHKESLCTITNSSASWLAVTVVEADPCDATDTLSAMEMLSVVETLSAVEVLSVLEELSQAEVVSPSSCKREEEREEQAQNHPRWSCSALETDEMAAVPSGRSKGGKDEEVKLLEMFLERCQKSRGELEFESF